MLVTMKRLNTYSEFENSSMAYIVCNELIAFYEERGHSRFRKFALFPLTNSTLGV
jgi:hypothetical protein